MLNMLNLTLFSSYLVYNISQYLMGTTDINLGFTTIKEINLSMSGVISLLMFGIGLAKNKPKIYK